MEVEAFIGTILPWAGNYAPRGWAFCQGQTLQISQNTALYSILGTTYGGDGTTTFCLPNLQGRVPIGVGTVKTETGKSEQYLLGKSGGDLSSGLPKHTHSANVADLKVSANFALHVSTKLASTTSPPSDAVTAANYGLAKVDSSGVGVDVNLYKDISDDGNSVVKLKSFPCEVTSSGGTVTVDPAGSGPFDQVPVVQPYQVINFIICLEGIYPSKN